MRCSFRIQVITEAFAYDADEFLNQNSSDIYFQREERPYVACTKGRFFSFTPGFSRVIGNGSRE